MGKVTLAPSLSFPADELATQVVACLGMRGSGKSNAMAVIVEGLLAADIQVIVLDYVGIWFSLRLDETGKHPSPYQIPVIGGAHGDTVLVPHAGSMVAEALAQSGSSAVLDVSGFSKTARCTFATDLGEALFTAKKKHPGPTFLVLEEAQRYIPQKLFRGQERMLGAFEEIAEVGRNYGLGLGMISQRPQKIAKDVLNLTELLLAFQTNGVLERRAIAEWVQEKDAKGRSEVNDELPSLGRGRALVWSPSWQRIYGKYDLRKKTTYDAGATPLRARAAVKVKPLDLAALEASMAEVVEQAKANDPKALRAEVARLQRELEAARKAGPAAPPVEVMVEVPVLPPALGVSLKRMEGVLRDCVSACCQMQEVPASPASLPTTRTHLGTLPKTPQASRPRPAPPPVTNGAWHPPAGARRMLEAVATSHADGLTWRQVAQLAGMKASGGSFLKYKSLLRTHGCVDERGDLVHLSEAGRALAGDPGAPMTGIELLEFWKPKLPGKAKDMLNEAWAVGPRGSITREALAGAVGMEVSGGSFLKYLSVLRSNGLIEERNGGFGAAEVFYR